MAASPLTKASKLSQTRSTWQATVRPAPAWIAPKNQPKYRPYIIMIADTEAGRIRQMQMEEHRPTPEAVLSSIAAAMMKPMLMSGKRERPARIVLDDQELVRFLTPELAGIGIRCDYASSLAVINDAMSEMAAHLNRGEERPSVLATPGVTLPLFADLCEAAAEFYQRAPWRWLDNLAAIEVRYPADGPARYLVIMGFGGQEFGLALYPTLEDLRWQISGLEPPEIYEKLTTTSLTFDEADVLAFEDLDAIEKHGWPVAGPRAYPLLMRITPPAEVSVPGANEVALLAAALRTLPDFVTEHLHADRGAPQPAEATFALSNVHANGQIAYRYPVDLPELAALRNNAALDDVELEEMIAGWYWDDASHAYARQVGTLLLEFLSYLEWTGLSEQTLRKHDQNCWLIGKFTLDYGGYETFTPAIFLGEPGHLAEFKHKVSSSPNAINAYKATWRKLGRYIRERNYA